VVLIHFPIAPVYHRRVAFDLCGAMDATSAIARRCWIQSWSSQRCSLSPVIVTGLLAWQWALEGQKLKRDFADASGLCAHFQCADVVHRLAAFFGARTRPKYLLPGYRIPLEL